MNGLRTDDQPAILGDILERMNALAEPTRVRTLRLVEGCELTVADLCSVLQAPQSTVSRHLKVLADSGWVTARPEGPSRLYRMAAGLDPSARRLWVLLREQASQTTVAGGDDRRLARVLVERRTRSQAFFSSAAGQWEKVRRELFGERFDAVAIAALLDDGWTVGDLGCGSGSIAERIAPFVRRVVAVEGSRAMLAAARRRLGDLANVEIRPGELEALPIDDGALDAATMSLVLHHVADPGEAIREAARVLRPGGRILVVDMFRHDRTEYQQQMGHVWLGFETGQIVAWLEESGFEAARVLPLPLEPSAKGPPLFVATARSTQASGNAKTSGRRRKGAARKEGTR